jgi:hypothetical protein
MMRFPKSAAPRHHSQATPPRKKIIAVAAAIVASVPGKPLESFCFFLPIKTAMAPPAAGHINGQAREP